MNQLQEQDRGGKNQCDGIRDNDRAGPKQDSVYQPATDTCREQQPHDEAHVGGALRPESLQGLRQKRQSRQSTCNISEYVDHFPILTFRNGQIALT